MKPEPHKDPQKYGPVGRPILVALALAVAVGLFSFGLIQPRPSPFVIVGLALFLAVFILTKGDIPFSICALEHLGGNFCPLVGPFKAAINVTKT